MFIWSMDLLYIVNYNIAIIRTREGGEYKMETKYNYLARRKGTSERGDFYVITLVVGEEGEKGKRFTSDFFVPVELYVKCDAFVEFQQVDAIFVPDFKGRAKLVCIEGL